MVAASCLPASRDHFVVLGAALHGVMELPILMDSSPYRRVGAKGCVWRGAVSRHSGWQRR